MKCYICHESVEHWDYTRHIRSHLVEGETGSGYDINYEYDEDGYSSVDYSDYSFEEDFRDRDTTFTVPGPTLPRTTSVAPRTGVNRSKPKPKPKPNAFQFWLQNFKPDFPEYTTIDGQKKRNSDSEAEEFIRTAKILRNTSKAEVVKNVKEFKGFSDSEKLACLELVRKVPIFPGLVAYVYTHLIKCVPRRWFSSWDTHWFDRVPDLQRLVETWYEDGDIKCILSYGMIKKRLLEFLRDARGSPDKHKCNQALLNGMTMLDCDTRNLTAVVAICITKPQRREFLILIQRGNQATARLILIETLAELFHSLLEVNVKLEERYWRCFFNALVMFSRECGYCPRGIYLADGSISDLSPDAVLGGFGTVSKGKIGSRLVAVKVLNRAEGSSWSEYKKELSKEAIVWRRLCHPNCLPLYGVYEMPTTGYINVALVSPWMENGTLADYLKKNSKANRTRLILDVVRGLNYLHSMKPHVAHRDIKPENILITNKGRACLSDFGLASVFDVDLQPSMDLRGTPDYKAPEMFLAKNEDAKRKLNRRACDMYALGCTIYVVYTAKSPGKVHDDLKSNQLPVKISADMWSFVQNLCSKVPSKRLTAEMAVNWMEVKARQEGVDARPASFEEGWEWRGPTSSDKCLWSVS